MYVRVGTFFMNKNIFLNTTLHRITSHFIIPITLSALSVPIGEGRQVIGRSPHPDVVFKSYYSYRCTALTHPAFVPVSAPTRLLIRVLNSINLLLDNSHVRYKRV